MPKVVNIDGRLMIEIKRGDKMLGLVWYLDAPLVLLAIGILKVDYWLTRKVYGDNEISEEYLNGVVRLIRRIYS